MDAVNPLAAAQETVKALLGVAKSAAMKAAEPELKSKLLQIQLDIVEAQASLADVVAERLDLLRQVAELREKLNEVTRTQAVLSGYVLHTIEPGVFLYKSKAGSAATVEHYACPRCYSGGAMAVMQATRGPGSTTRWRCSVCPFELLTGSPRAAGASVDLGDSGWMPS